jgi:hypothetical protein
MPGMSYEEKEIVLDSDEAAFFYSDGLVGAGACPFASFATQTRVRILDAYLG